MPKFVIERNIKGVGQMSPEEMRGAAQKSCSVLQKLGPQVQWQQTFVTRDKLYCVYLAPDEALIRLHAEQSGFPADRISQVAAVLDPASAD
jgi:cell division inhibitor SulA